MASRSSCQMCEPSSPAMGLQWCQRPSSLQVLRNLSISHGQKSKPRHQRKPKSLCFVRSSTGSSVFRLRSRKRKTKAKSVCNPTSENSAYFFLGAHTSSRKGKQHISHLNVLGHPHIRHGCAVCLTPAPSLLPICQPHVKPLSSFPKESGGEEGITEGA